MKESVFGAIIGVGQCGTRLAFEFQERGYNVYYINTDSHDAISSEKHYMIDTNGTGGSPLKGRQLAEKNRTQLVKLLKTVAKESQSVLFLGGAGGGTGGGVIPVMLEIAQELNITKAGVFLTLPLQMLDILATSNALKTLKDVKNQASYIILADNQYLLDKLSVGHKHFWSNVNTHIVNMLTSLDNVYDVGKTSLAGMGSIDQQEVFRLLHTHKGICDIGVIYLPDSTLSLDTTVIQERIFEPCLIQGLDYKKSTSYLCCIDTPLNTALYNHVAINIFNIIKQKHGNAISRLGMFQSKAVNDGVIVTRFTSGLDYPKIIQSRLKNLKRDEARFLNKKQQERLTQTDEIELIDLDEFI